MHSLWMVLVVIQYSLTSPSDTFTVDGVEGYIVFTILTTSDTFTVDGVGCYIVFY